MGTNLISRVKWYPGGWRCWLRLEDGRMSSMGQFGLLMKMSKNRKRKIGRWLIRHYVKPQLRTTYGN